MDDEMGRAMPVKEIVALLIKKGKEKIGPLELWKDKLKATGLEDDDLALSLRLTACTMGLHLAAVIERADEDRTIGLILDAERNHCLDTINLLINERKSEVAYGLYTKGIKAAFDGYAQIIRGGVPEVDDEVVLLALAARAVRYYLNYTDAITPIKPGDKLSVEEDLRARALLAFMGRKYLRAEKSGMIEGSNEGLADIFDGMAIEVAVVFKCIQPISLADLVATITIKRTLCHVPIPGISGYAS